MTKATFYPTVYADCFSLSNLC